MLLQPALTWELKEEAMRTSILVVVCLVSMTGVASAQTPEPPSQPAADTGTVHETAVPFRSIFTGLGHDVRHLPSPANGLILGVAGFSALAIHPRDEVLTRRASNSEPIDETFDAGAALGNGVTQFGLAFGTYVVGRATGHANVALTGSDLVRGQIVNALLTQGVKFSVQRRRPNGGRYSFPSGHTSAAFVTAAVVQRHYGWRLGVPAYGLASYVAMSRLSENRHFASDVLVGAAIGMVSGRAVTVGRGRAQFDLAPIGVRGGGGVGFTLRQTP